MTLDEMDMRRQENMEHYGFGPGTMKHLKVCKSCGEMALSEQQFCMECGVRLPDTTLYDLYQKMHTHCRICNMIVADSAQFCPRCGSEIKKKQPIVTKEENQDGVF